MSHNIIETLHVLFRAGLIPITDIMQVAVQFLCNYGGYNDDIIS